MKLASLPSLEMAALSRHSRGAVTGRRGLKEGLGMSGGRLPLLPRKDKKWASNFHVEAELTVSFRPIEELLWVNVTVPQ